MKAIIVTEGGKNIGFGHITRCISLYQTFKESGITAEFIVNGDESIKGLLKDKDYKIFNWAENEKDLFNIIKRCDMAVIDSYLANPQLYKKVSEITKLPVYIDDNNRINFPRGVVVNGALNAEKLGYFKDKEVIYLLGIYYALLRRKFWDVPDKEIKEDIRTIMVTFGGSDMNNMTPKILRFLNREFPGVIKKVIIGRCFQNTKEIENLKNGKTDLIYNPDAEGIKELMLECDIAISAGGQTLYEFARIGVPVIVIAVAENQLSNIRGWQETGYIDYAGWWKDKNALENISICIRKAMDKELRADRSLLGKKLVDGRGAGRIADFLLETFPNADKYQACN